ncbi:hypothetical protein BGZ95_005373, partial [Linnemannia exigua]
LAGLQRAHMETACTGREKMLAGIRGMKSMCMMTHISMIAQKFVEPMLREVAGRHPTIEKGLENNFLRDVILSTSAPAAPVGIQHIFIVGNNAVSP